MRQQTLNFRSAPSREELDCIEELKCFTRFGDYALVLLPRVIGNIWKHYKIERNEDRARILRAANIQLGEDGSLLA
jgi:hypothetical protein